MTWRTRLRPSGREPEFDYYIPAPQIILCGCTPLVPLPPPSRGESPPCPTCGSQPYGRYSAIRRDDHYCLRCDHSSERIDARCRKAKAGIRAALKQTNEILRLNRWIDGAASKAARGKGPVLTECERRRVYNGYKGGVLAEWAYAPIGSLAAVGREFLAAIDQLPDWSKQLDRRGRPVRLAAGVA